MSDKKSLTRRQVLKGAGAIALTGASQRCPSREGLGRRRESTALGLYRRLAAVHGLSFVYGGMQG